MKTQIEKKLKKYSAKQLSAKLEKNSISEVEKEVIIEILKSRGQDVSKWEEVVEKVDTNEKEVNSEDLLDSMKKEVDEFVDSLIEEKRTGVYNQVMKSLGGNFDSDLDDLLEEVTEQQLKEALSFKGIKKVSEKIEKSKTTPKEKSADDKKSKSKSIFLEESEETKGLKSNSNVEFKAAANSKYSNQFIKGVVVSVYKCHNANFKEYCKISTEHGIFYKRSKSVKVL